MNRATLTKEQKIEFILAIRGIGWDDFIKSEYDQMQNDELQIEFDFYVTDFNG
tara:strand:+ start:370 stop:528 length:159 start_codon:yes stop_codon:yes gene_type:complete